MMTDDDIERDERRELVANVKSKLRSRLPGDGVALSPTEARALLEYLQVKADEIEWLVRSTHQLHLEKNGLKEKLERATQDAQDLKTSHHNYEKRIENQAKTITEIGKELENTHASLKASRRVVAEQSATIDAYKSKLVLSRNRADSLQIQLDREIELRDVHTKKVIEQQGKIVDLERQVEEMERVLRAEKPEEPEWSKESQEAPPLYYEGAEYSAILVQVLNKLKGIYERRQSNMISGQLFWPKISEPEAQALYKHVQELVVLLKKRDELLEKNEELQMDAAVDMDEIIRELQGIVETLEKGPDTVE